MADTEMVENPEVEQTEEPTQETETTEEVQEEAFDKERAMATIKNLRKFEKDAAKLSKELESYKLKEEERKKAELSEIDRLKLEAQEAKEKLAELTLDKQRREVAEKVKLPFALADRIKGETLEEMEADAKTLFDSLPKGFTPKTGVTNPGSQAIEPTTQRLNADIDPFSPAWVKAHGGGVVGN
jgi:hypothetical protein